MRGLPVDRAALINCSFAFLWLMLPAAASGEELLLSSFDGLGFSFTYGGFSQQQEPTGTRLIDPEDGWGAGVRNASLNLSPLEDGRLVVDFTPNANHQTDFFLVQLNDANGLSGRWTFNTGGLEAGVPVNLVSQNPISQPDATYDTNNMTFVDTPPDLTRITNWAVEGQFGSPAPFDITFDNLKISTDVAAPPPYPGFEPDAPWRSVAATRIDALRKGDLTVRVRDAAGNPVPGAQIRVEQQAHEFGFGSAMQAFRLRDNNPIHDQYKQKASELFNVGTIENNLKWKAWEGEFGPNFTQQGADDAVAWLETNGVEPRGHVMVWPGANHLPSDVVATVGSAPLSPAEQQQLRERVSDHITEIGTRFAGKIVAWDVINEPRANHDLMDVLSEGDGAMISWLQQAAAAAPDAKLFLNEFGILTSGGATNSSNQQLLESQLSALIAGGAPIDGVGLQGHFSDGNLTGPEQLWQILDRYANLGLQIQVTEFDHGTDDEQLQAAYLRDFFTAVFAHEGVTDLIQWGFWEDAHFDPQRALFRSDWSIKPNGQAYLDLVFDEWWTDETLQTDGNGEAEVRGFKGTHTVTVTWEGQDVSVEATIDGSGNDITVNLPGLLGDLDSDGDVDLSDLALWQREDGTSEGLDHWEQGLVVQVVSTVGASYLVPEPVASVLILAGVTTAGLRPRLRS